MEVLIRRMEERDLDRIVEIEKDSFTTPWSRESLMMELTENLLARYIVAEVDGVVAGYGGMWIIVGEGHITNIAVESKYRERGIGKKIVEELVRIGRKLFLNAMTLEVRKSNFKAQNLYKQYGFVERGIRPNYYADDNEDAIIMWKNFEE